MLATALLVSISPVAAWAVMSADEVCPPMADPCIVTTGMAVDDGAVLDFGLRTVSVIQPGSLDFGTGNGVVLCGEFLVNTNSIGIKVRGPDGFGGSLGGQATIWARRGCSGDGTTPCFRDAACAAAGLGSCSAGNSGLVEINGKILGAANEAAFVAIKAAADLRTTRQININGTRSESDGGELILESVIGSLTVEGTITATSGGDGMGGLVIVNAGGDISVNAAIDASGGAGGGGEILLDALGALNITNDLLVKSTNGDGPGGFLSVLAEGDIVIEGSASTDQVLLSSRGNASLDGVGGPGGEQEFVAGGNITFGRFAKLVANGAPPDGDAAEFVAFVAGGDLLVEGEIQAKALGNQGRAGIVDLNSATAMEIGSTAVFDLTGGRDVFGQRGGLQIWSLGNLGLHGSIDASGRGSNPAGFVMVVANGDVDMSGSIRMHGTPASEENGIVDFQVCRLRMNPTAVIDSSGGFDVNGLIIRESATFASGSQLLASTGSGVNRITYRDTTKPPILSGTIIPEATLVNDPSLMGCPICGNGEVDQGESCDDGNTVAGDGCNAECQSEGCVVQTPGFPVVPLCDDGISCTADSCDAAAGTCVNTPTSALCDDGDPCTDNNCIPASGCTSAANTASCDDGNACSTNDRCEQGLCVGGAPPTCDDGNLCTDDSCDPVSGCTSVANTALCADGNACTTNDRCEQGLCVGGAPPTCDDGNPCTDDNCIPVSGCTSEANTAGCDDGNACTTGDTCNSGLCVGGAPPNCDDGNLCTNDSCDPASGCTSLANTAGCDDANACTTGDTCSGGVCVGGAPPNCDDSKVCTDDSCDPASGCANVANTAVCDDGNPCTTGDTCGGGVCVGGAPPNCDDSKVCTDDSCDPASGCSNLANTVPCNDGNACTTVDNCLAEVCVGSVASDCDDGNHCTDDACDPASGCVNANDDTNPCSNGNASDNPDACVAGVCLGTGGCQGSDANCNDTNPCTDDSCLPSGACEHVNNTLFCDDGNPCTTADTCVDGACVGGAPANCDDSNPCTDDSCNPASGCSNLANTAPCDDGNACTANDTCEQGLCVGGAPPNCDDSNVCTDDSCNPASGCSNLDNTEPCDDGNACTAGDTCNAVLCIGGAPANCNDSNVCTDDSCNPASGCSNLANTAPCDDGNACTTNDTCNAGLCIGGAPANCDDSNVCTDDSCNPASGCSNLANTALCDDGDPCTTDDLCSAGSCVGTQSGCDSASGELGPDGGTITTDQEADGATPADPIETTVTSPHGGNVNILEWQIAESLLAVDLSAPLSTPELPLTILFCLDASLGRAAVAQVAWNYSAVADCVGPVAAASPDPCIQSRVSTPNNDVEVTIIASAASGLWTVAAVAGCPQSPSEDCLEARKARLDIKNHPDDGRDRLKWVWLKGDALVQAALGDPLTATAYRLCLYDSVAGAATLVGEVVVSPNSGWRDKAPRGWRYKDRYLVFDGVQKVRLRTGGDGKTKAGLRAKGTETPMPGTVSNERFFFIDPWVSAQMTNGAGLCWNSRFWTAKHNSGTRFKAKFRP